MRPFASSLIGLGLGLVSLGGIAEVVLTYPKSEHTSIFVSPDTVSTWTETAAQDHLVPNSQVFITGRGSSVAEYFGLLGTAVNRAQNQSAAGTAAASLRLNFSADLARVLKDKVNSRALSARFSIVDAPDGADAKLLPFARLTVGDDDSARLSFRLTVRFTDAITKSEVKKEYYYFHGGGHPISGSGSWSEDSAKLIRMAAKEALALLSDVFLDDIGGLYSGAFDADKQHFISYTIVGVRGNVGRSLLLHDYPDHVVVATLIKDRPNKNIVIILERRSIVMQGS